jgi:hypothetical protein
LARGVLQGQRRVAHKTAEEFQNAVLQGSHNAQGQLESLQSLLDDRVSRTAVDVQEFGADEMVRIQDQRLSSAAMHGWYQTLNLEEPMLQLGKRNVLVRWAVLANQEKALQVWKKSTCYHLEVVLKKARMAIHDQTNKY